VDRRSQDTEATALADQAISALLDPRLEPLREVISESVEDPVIRERFFGGYFSLLPDGSSRLIRVRRALKVQAGSGD
jgi:hypothetical protein